MSDTDPTQAKQEWRHNWLYSVLPTNDQLYLCGYCRICDNAFAKIIPHSTYVTTTGEEFDILVTKMDVPKWGCVDPNDPQYGN